MNGCYRRFKAVRKKLQQAQLYFSYQYQGVAGEGHNPKVQAYKGSLHMIARTLWSFRCKEWLLCCPTRHGRLICASVHRHAVQNLFDLSQAWRLHARLNGIAVQAT